MDQRVKVAGTISDSLLTEHIKARLYELTLAAEDPQ
jgi:hypothetical protein